MAQKLSYAYVGVHFSMAKSQEDHCRQSQKTDACRMGISMALEPAGGNLCAVGDEFRRNGSGECKNCLGSTGA